MTTEKKKFESITDNFLQKLDELEEMERPDPSRVLSMLSLREEIDYLLADKEKNEAEIALLKAEIDELYEQLQKKPKVNAGTVEDYKIRMPEIVKAVLNIKAKWDGSREKSPIRKYGFTDQEISKAAPDTVRAIRVAIKKALPENGMKAWLENKPRPSG